MTDIDELMTRMTLEEKCAQLGCMWFSGLLVNGELALDRLALAAGDGIGQVGRIAIESGSGPERVAELGNQVQRYFVEETRLGIPAVIHEESTGGFCAREATQFPQGINLAVDLGSGVGRAGGRSDRSSAPRRRRPVDAGTGSRHRPRCPLGPPGGDIRRRSRAGQPHGRRLRARGASHRASSPPPSIFSVTARPKGGFNWGWSSMGPRHLRDVIAAPFRAVINEAGVGAVMPSYNEIDGLPLHGSPELLTELLREELGFTGVTVADYFGVGSLEDFHHCASDEADAARRALLAGLDMELPSYWCYRQSPSAGETLAPCRWKPSTRPAAVCSHRRRSSASSSSPTSTRPPRRPCSTRSRTAPWHGEPPRPPIVLLANDGVLPLRAGARVAVLGPSADDPRLLLGDYHFPAHLELQHEEAALSPVGSEFSRSSPRRTRRRPRWRHSGRGSRSSTRWSRPT